MAASSAIRQRDLRLRSREIMDAVGQGQPFAVTRDGQELGTLNPIPPRSRFVSRAEFAATSALRDRRRR